MPIVVTISSNQGTYEGGTYSVGPNVQIQSAFSSVQINSLTFGSGTFITTSGPAGAYGCLIVPPTGNLQTLTLKGITGDTGIPISSSQPTLLSFSVPSSSNAVGLTSGGAITGVVTLTFF